MEITGRVTKILPLQTGQGKNGTWKKQDFVIETPGQYPKSVALSLWGEKVDETRLAVGQNITASINLESREYNSRWYTEARVWKISGAGSGSGSPQQSAPPQQENSFTPDSSGVDDLPFAIIPLFIALFCI